MVLVLQPRNLLLLIAQGESSFSGCHGNMTGFVLLKVRVVVHYAEVIYMYV